jgi:hypothetical protein
VQIDPEHDDRWAAVFLTVTELMPGWNGLQGFEVSPGQEGRAYYRGPGKAVVRIGSAAWMPADEASGEEDGEPS